MSPVAKVPSWGIPLSERRFLSAFIIYYPLSELVVRVISSDWKLYNPFFHTEKGGFVSVSERVVEYCFSTRCGFTRTSRPNALCSGICESAKEKFAACPRILRYFSRVFAEKHEAFFNKARVGLSSDPLKIIILKLKLRAYKRSTTSAVRCRSWDPQR